MPSRRTAVGVNRVMLSIAFVLIVFGGTAQALGLGASVIDTYNVASPSVSCQSTGSCVITAQVTNNNYTLGAQSFVYLTAKDSQGQEVLIQQQSVSTIPAGGTGQVTFDVQVVPGSYTGSIWVSTNGIPTSTVQTFQISIASTVQVVVYSDQPDGVTVQGVQPTPSSSSSCGTGCTSYSFSPGASATVTYVDQGTTLIFQCSSATSYPGETCSDSSATTQTISFTASNEPGDAIFPMTAPSPSTQFIALNVVAVPGPQSQISGSVSPSGTVKVYQPGGSNPSSVTFTASPSGFITGWSVINGQGVSTSIAGSTGSVTVTYQQISALEPSGDPQVPMTLQVTFSAVVLTVIQPSSPLLTISPAPGQHDEAPGSTVTVSVTGLSNFCSAQWMVDSTTTNASSPSIQVTMDTAHSVSIVAQACGSVVISAATGITTTPAAGTYSPTPGKPYVISESTQTGYCFTGWSVNGRSEGDGSSVTVDPSATSQYIVSANGVPVSGINPGGTACYSQALLTIGSSASEYPGSVTTTPQVGTYPENYSSSVTVSANVAPGYCWGGWYFDGSFVTGSTSYTATMPSGPGQQLPVLTATVTPKPSGGGGCTAPGGSPPVPSFSVSGISWVGIGSIGAGVILGGLSFVPLTRRR